MGSGKSSKSWEESGDSIYDQVIRSSLQILNCPTQLTLRDPLVRMVNLLRTERQIVQ